MFILSNQGLCMDDEDMIYILIREKDDLGIKRYVLDFDEIFILLAGRLRGGWFLQTLK